MILFNLDGSSFKIKYDEIDFSCDTLSFNVDDTEIIVDLFKPIEEIETHLLDDEENDQNRTTADAFLWNDASTKLFLDIYKRKRDLVNTRKIKTYKLLWKNIAEDMSRSGYLVTPLIYMYMHSFYFDHRRMGLMDWLYSTGFLRIKIARSESPVISCA